MEGFHLTALYSVDKTIMRGSDLVVVSEFNHYRKCKQFEHCEAAVVIAHVV